MKNAEQPAFPRAGSEHTNLADHITHEPTEGLTKREYFAAMAMRGLISGDALGTNAEYVVTASIKFADELLRQLES